MKLEKYLSDLRYMMKEKKISRNDLAKELNVNVSTINNMFRMSNGTISNLKKISDFINNKEG